MTKTKGILRLEDGREISVIIDGDLITPAEKKETKRWRAKKGQGYWIVDLEGDAVEYEEEGEPFDNYTYSIGNYFNTQQEAEAYRKHLITMQRIKDRIIELNDGWKWTPDEEYTIITHNKEGFKPDTYRIDNVCPHSLKMKNQNVANAIIFEFDDMALFNLFYRIN